MATAFQKTTLGLALLKGRLYARVFRGNEVISRWDAPDWIAGLDGLNEVLQEVPKETGFKGESVVVVLASSQINAQVIKTPPMREKDLEAFLARKARMEAGKSKIAWSYRSLFETHKGEGSVGLNLVPHQMVDSFLKFGRERNYQVDLMLPLASAVSYSLRELPIDKDKWAMAAAEIDGGTILVVGRPDGSLALVRELAYDWGMDESLDRAGRELNRSVLFAKQQFGVTVESIWLAGSDVETASVDMKRHTGLPIQKLPFEDIPGAWLGTLLHLSSSVTDNLVPKDARRHNQRRRSIQWSIGLILGLNLLLGGVVASMRAAIALADHQILSLSLDDRVAKLLSDQADFENRLAEIEQLQGQRKFLDSAQQAPVPGWFAGYAASVIPDGLRLKILRLEKDSATREWLVRLEGTGPRQSVASAENLRRFQADLMRGAPRMRIDAGWDVQWLANLRQGSSAEPDSLGKPFAIFGRLP